jgi:hypothetical protein
MSSPRPSRLVTVAQLLFNAAPAAIVLGYLLTFGVNVPFWDQWDFVPMLRRFYEGRLSFRELWEPYAEQRLLIPRVAMLLLARATGYDVVAEMLLSWVLLALSVV